ncbi:MAG: phosphotransferase [Anaerolineaceae bacterium]|nr:phosphotransferase [Anaerolineaceae bacterium]
MTDLLQRIQELQFADKGAAEALLLDFVREIYAPDVQSIELRPLAVSLNSFNGFLTRADGIRLFFKTHTESDTVIGEYYQAALLAEAGYPVIRPVFSSTETGKQLLIYEVIESPSVFDVAWAIETGSSDQFEVLCAAQQAGDDYLLALYRATLSDQSPQPAAQSPVHQLFYHRLHGGRLERFYGPLAGQSGDFPSVALPGGSRSIAEVRRAHWEINGQVYSETLDAVIERALRLLQPEQAGPAIIGHGDAHNGNVFLQQSGDGASLLYFDPAFAGRHHPLLDLTKPLFHNVFAMWMYFPQEKQQQTPISLQVDGHTWRVTYDYALHPVRSMFWESKVERVLLPILIELKQRGWLRPDWRAYLKAALFCCPFLTMNLADSGRFPAEISLLGLAMAVEMGAESHGERSLLDRTLDQVESEL